MTKREREKIKKIILYSVVILVTLTTIILYTPIFTGGGQKKKKEEIKKENLSAEQTEFSQTPLINSTSSQNKEQQ